MPFNVVDQESTGQTVIQVITAPGAIVPTVALGTAAYVNVPIDEASATTFGDTAFVNKDGNTAHFLRGDNSFSNLTLASTTYPGAVPSLVTPGSGFGQQSTVWLRGDDTWETIASGGVPYSYDYDDFTSYSTASHSKLFSFAAQTAGGTVGQDPAQRAGHIGTLAMSATATTATGGYMNTASNCFWLDSSLVYTFRSIFYAPSVASGYCFFGLYNNGLATNYQTWQSAGAFLFNNSSNTYLACSNGTAQTNGGNLGATLTAGTWNVVQIQITSTKISLWVNGNFVSAYTMVDVPTVAMSPGFTLLGEGTATTMLIDTFEMLITPSTYSGAIPTPGIGTRFLMGGV